jgi:cell fate regulator YaaT (PSP1 superfamily)
LQVEIIVVPLQPLFPNNINAILIKIMEYRLYNGECRMNTRGCCRRQANKLNSYDYFCDIPESENADNFVEVQFKNTRKGYYLNSNGFSLAKGDTVAVEANPGHDIGTVTMTGKLVALQMKRAHVRSEKEVYRVYRKARQTDIEKYEEAKSKEHDTMIRSRKIAEKLGLQMKIGDVEYQGDGSKAIFYYIADERVDFRQLIKDLAETFHVRIEMKQIGVRQEAARIGGTGPCGREMCCSGWLSGFSSVSTNSARIQDISLNPQKLAGQCAKLKCCLNYEEDTYTEAIKRFPSREIRLETVDNTYFHFKTDVFRNQITYSTDRNIIANPVNITSERACEVIRMNRLGEKPKSLSSEEETAQSQRTYNDILGENNLSRFDSQKRKKKRNRTGNQTGTPLS